MSVLENWEERRAVKYLRQRDRMDRQYPRLRSLRARRRLVIVFEVAMALMAASGIALSLTTLDWLAPAWSLTWVAAAVLVLVVYTLLSIVTGKLDNAPMAALDEYERSRVEALRSLTYRMFLWFGVSFGPLLVVLGTLINVYRPDWAHAVPYITGIWFLVSFLYLSTLPTVVLAWTTPDD